MPHLLGRVQLTTPGVSRARREPTPDASGPKPTEANHRVSVRKSWQPKTPLTLPSLWTHRTRHKGLGSSIRLMIDDDSTSSNNWSGQFGIEIEATTKVSVRNLWVKKLR
jgi:hypothetical protein